MQQPLYSELAIESVLTLRLVSKRLLPLVPADLVVDQALPTSDHLTIMRRSRSMQSVDHRGGSALISATARISGWADQLAAARSNS